MAEYTTVSGPWKTKEKAKVPLYGKTVASTKATGRMIKLMALEDSSMLMVTAIKVNGFRTKPMARVSMSTLMGRDMLETGRMIRDMASALRSGKMELCTKVTMNLDISMGLENLNGLMDQYM